MNNKDLLYKDFPLSKKTTIGGELKMYENSDALSQAIRIWINSEYGEKIRTRSAGILTPFIGKPIDEYHKQELRVALIKGLKEDFVPSINIVSLDVQGDTVKQQWIISIVGYNADLAIGVNTRVVVSPLL